MIDFKLNVAAEIDEKKQEFLQNQHDIDFMVSNVNDLQHETAVNILCPIDKAHGRKTTLPYCKLLDAGIQSAGGLRNASDRARP